MHEQETCDENMNAVDGNMNTMTFAGETSPPKSEDKRLVLAE